MSNKTIKIVVVIEEGAVAAVLTDNPEGIEIGSIDMSAVGGCDQGGRYLMPQRAHGIGFTTSFLRNCVEGDIWQKLEVDDIFYVLAGDGWKIYTEKNEDGEWAGMIWRPLDDPPTWGSHFELVTELREKEDV